MTLKKLSLTHLDGWSNMMITMFPENRLTEVAKMDILRMAVKTVQKEVAKKSKQLYQIQAT
jgi:hypothetical protein